MPALNEAECIEDAVCSIPVKEFTKRGFETEILVVDNGSEDNTPELAESVNARVIREPRRGYGNAYRKGFQEARGSIICTLDADCSYPANDLPGMVEKLSQEGLDFISTNRFAHITNNVITPTNRFGNAILSFFSRVLFRSPFHDSQSGMWVFRAELVDRMQLRATGMALSQEIKIEAACRLKARCAELPVHYGHRRGSPKLRVWRDGFSNLFQLISKRLS